MGLGYALMQADLVGARDKAEVVARLREYEKTLPEGAWLLGNGWDQNDWPDKSFPRAADLDAAFPDRPIWLDRVDGHAGWTNRSAMKAAEPAMQGRPRAGHGTPEGGRNLRGGGPATGVCEHGAWYLVRKGSAEPVGGASETAE